MVSDEPDDGMCVTVVYARLVTVAGVDRFRRGFSLIQNNQDKPSVRKQTVVCPEIVQDKDNIRLHPEWLAKSQGTLEGLLPHPHPKKIG